MICICEVSALCRLRREGKLSVHQYGKAKRALLDDAEDASVVQITGEVLARAIELLERFPLRSSDALHVASALEWGSNLFVSADDRQCAAAEACGLRVERLSKQ